MASAADADDKVALELPPSEDEASTSEASASDSDFEANDADADEYADDYEGGDEGVVTGRGASGGGFGVVVWDCRHCTYRNDVGSKVQTDVCGVCEAPRDQVSDDDFEEEQLRAPRPKAAAKKRKRSSAAGKKPASKRRLGLADPMMQRPVVDEDEDEDAVVDVANMTVKPALPEATPPVAVTMPLLPFQKESLGWMLEQEAGPIKGGILADEMGMGKTIQAITLIVANLPPSRKQKGPPNTAAAAAAAAASKSQRPQSPLASPASDDDFEDAEVVATVTAAERENAAKAAAVDLEDALCKPAAAPTLLLAAKRPTLCGATLVICPVAALMQWKHEIEKHVTPGTLSVYLLRGILTI